jgi:glycosyltransferase involved in cell wall biosynthesis
MTTVYLKVPLSPYSGYGADGIGIAKALIESGADVFVEPTVVQYPLPEVVNNHINRPVRGPFDVAIVHVDPMNLKATDELRAEATTLIGWTMWEYTSLSNMAGSWEDKKNPPQLDEYMRENLRNFDILVAYDPISKGALEPYFDGPIITVQGGFDPTMWPRLANRDWNSPEFRFCMIGVLSERKDPFVAIQAFGQAKEADPEFNRWARLSLKTVAVGLHSKMEDMFGEVEGTDGRRYEQAEDGTLYQSLRIFYDNWDTETVRQFYAANHVLLAPSRGEGKNMPALEFMSTGGTVIATNWGGHLMWLSNEYAYPLDYELAPCEPGSDSMNARASVEHLRDLMLHTFHHRVEAREKGEIASSTIPVMSAWSRVMDRLFNRCAEELGGSKGTALDSAVAGLNFHQSKR